MSSKHTNDGVDVDNFVPSVGDDGSIGGIDNFLDGDIMQQDNIQKGNRDATAIASNNYDDSSGDEVVGNPMVAKVMDDDSDIELGSQIWLMLVHNCGDEMIMVMVMVMVTLAKSVTIYPPPSSQLLIELSPGFDWAQRW